MGMTERGDPSVIGVLNPSTSRPQEVGAGPVAPTATQIIQPGTVPNTNSASKSGYLSGMSSWLTSSSSPIPAPAKSTSSAPHKPVQIPQPVPAPQLPTHKFAATSFNTPKS